MLASTSLDSISQMSLVAIGLIIALYAIIISQIKVLKEARLKELNNFRKKKDHCLEQLNSDNENKELVEEYGELLNKIKTLASTPYHYDFGYLISGVCFAVSLILTYVPLYFGQSSLGKLALLVDYSPIICFVGIVNFLYVWFRTMIDLRNLALVGFDEETDYKKTIQGEIKSTEAIIKTDTSSVKYEPSHPKADRTPIESQMHNVVELEKKIFAHIEQKYKIKIDQNVHLTKNDMHLELDGIYHSLQKDEIYEIKFYLTNGAFVTARLKMDIIRFRIMADQYTFITSKKTQPNLIIVTTTQNINRIKSFLEKNTDLMDNIQPIYFDKESI